MLDFLIFAVTFLVILIVAVIYLYPGSSRSTTIPGLDPSDPKDGNLADLAKSGSLHEFLVELHDKYGGIVSFWMGQKMVVSIATPELFKEHSRVFDRPPELFQLFEPLITPHSIQFANGADGRNRRHIYDKCYSHDAMAKYYTIFEDNAAELASKLSSLTPDDHIPLSQYMFALAIKGIARASFGIQLKDDKQVLRLRRNYDWVWSDMESRVAGDIPTPGSAREKNFDTAKDEMYAIMEEAIKTRRAKSGKIDEYLLIDALIESGLSEEVIQADAMTYLVGGFHTTGLMLTWGIYFLATHSEAQEKIYEELTTKLTEQYVSPSNIQDLKYTKQVLDETLRCSVLAPWAARFQDFDIQLGGHTIPKGTPVIHALGVTLQDETQWPHPNKFDPDRFDDSSENKRANFSFEPFGFAGKRKCPGYRFAYVEATVVLAILLKKFSFHLVEGQVVVPEYGLVTKPKDEIWVTIKKRK